jgi:hypothetical protein
MVGGGVHLRPRATPRPRQQPLGRARTRAAGRPWLVKGVGVRPPNDGQAADDARPRPPEDATVPQRWCTHVVSVCRSPASFVHARMLRGRHPHLPPLRRRRRRRRGEGNQRTSQEDSEHEHSERAMPIEPQGGVGSMVVVAETCVINDTEKTVPLQNLASTGARKRPSCSLCKSR